MSDLPIECEVCHKAHDFSKWCSGSCSTCGKQWMCEPCCYSHECIPGKGRQLRIITNPAWIMNLRQTFGKTEPKPYKHEVYDKIIEEVKKEE